MPRERIKNLETPKLDNNTIERLKKSPEKENSPEKEGSLASTQSIEQVKEDIMTDEEKARGVAPSTSHKAQKKTTEDQIDKILSENLNDIYLSMSKTKQAIFRKEGEETVKKINKVLHQTKNNISKIVRLIIKWLSIIPNVNKYFIEKEAKIKTDKIIKLNK